MHKNTIITLILAFSIISTALILGNSFKNRNENQDAISVIGLGSKNFISDEILWKSSFSRHSMDIKEAYSKISTDQQIISSFFQNKGFKTNEFHFEGIKFEKKYKEIRIENKENNYNTEFERIFDGYEARQNIIFNAKRNPQLMKKIEEVSSKTSELVNSGIELESYPIQYTYSDLPSLKQNLIEKATIDAKERAEKIVANANGDLGKLKNANMGVFQITGQGSTEEDSYGGNFDVYSKNKTARITMRLEYELD